MKFWSSIGVAALAVSTTAFAEAPASGVESYVEVPMPPGFGVQATELEGPVFTDNEDRTLYIWPLHKQRNGYSGESPGTPRCYDEVLTVTAGLMSPYPAGIELPDLDNRPSCTDLWPPVLADEDAKAVGDWSIVTRRDGQRQWAFREQPIYTSVRDQQPGDVLGGTSREYGGDSPANRVPIGPPPLVPPGFSVTTTTSGRLLTTDKNESIYAHVDDTPDQSRCDNECLLTWRPVLAPALASARDDWALLERSPGVRQWVFRGKPLYTYALDQHSWSMQGGDEPGWGNVYTQRTPPFPDSFTVQESLAGDVLADSSGMTVYTYVCGDDSADQLACDHPDDPQAYRLAMCGGGDAKKCLAYWPYVRAGVDAESRSGAWSVMAIDPATGHRAAPEEPSAVRVWAYRDRPVYTFSGDERPGDLNGAGTGEWRGQRNGLQAFWLRDDYWRGAR